MKWYQKITGVFKFKISLVGRVQLIKKFGCECLAKKQYCNEALSSVFGRHGFV